QFRLEQDPPAGGAVGFFFQAEDGIRDRNVTGVQTCALPISASDIVIACTVPPKRFTTSSRARSPASGLRDVMTTSAPARANSPAARIPTGPVPATMRTRWPRERERRWTIFSTAATAVVLEPFESSMSETRNGPKNAC